MKSCSSPCDETTITSRAGFWNKLLMACILIPTGAWAIEKVQPHVHPHKLLTAAYRVYEKCSMNLREQLHTGMRNELQEKIARIKQTVDEIEASIAEIAEFDPELAASQQRSLTPLKEELAGLLAMNESELASLGKQVIADLDRRINDTRADAGERELLLTLRKSRLQFQAAEIAASQVKHPRVTRTLNTWLEAIDKNDLSAAQELMTHRAAIEFTSRKMAMVKARLDSHFESLQVARRSDGRIGFTIGTDRIFVGLDADRRLIDTVELDF